MKIIQSFWSKPSLNDATGDGFSKLNGGWLDARYNLYAWALSCLKFRDFYNRVELYTDDAGKELLIDQLGLPYTHVFTDLNALSGYDPKLWSMGKIYAYGLQNEPFIHADSDVFIWEKFSSDLENAPLIAQSPEHNPIFYGDVINEMQAHFRHIPAALSSYWKAYPDYPISNTGIIGGTRYGFFKRFADSAFSFVEKNKDALRFVKLSKLCITLDQHYFRFLADQEDLPVAYRFHDNVEEDDFSALMRFNLVPFHDTYIHLLAYSKKNVFACEQLAGRLQYEFPDYYERINSFLQGTLSDNYYFRLAKDGKSAFRRTSFLLNNLGCGTLGDQYTEIRDAVAGISTATDTQKMLADIFSLEEKIYHYKNTMESNGAGPVDDNSLRRKLGPVFDLIYNTTPEKLLSVPFRLNEEVLLLKCDHYFDLAGEGNTTPSDLQPDKDQNVLVYYSEQQKIFKEEKLDNWGQLLPRFRMPLSGAALVEELYQDEVVAGTFTKEELSFSVLDFITSKWIYDRILVPV